MDKKTCMECGEPFVGRSDKKFCSDACRNAHNNQVNKDDKNFIRNTNNQLRKNWRILEELNPTEKHKVTKKQLSVRGFDFNLFTNIYTTKEGATYYFCYNQGYLSLENDYYLLVKKSTNE